MQTAAPKDSWSIALYYNRGLSSVHSWGGQIHTIGKKKKSINQVNLKLERGKLSSLNTRCFSSPARAKVWPSKPRNKRMSTYFRNLCIDWINVFQNTNLFSKAFCPWNYSKEYASGVQSNSKKPVPPHTLSRGNVAYVFGEVKISDSSRYAYPLSHFRKKNQRQPEAPLNQHLWNHRL